MSDQLILGNNDAANIAAFNLGMTMNKLSQATKELSSGLQVNDAGDNPAAYMISQQEQSQISGLQVAEQNTQEALSLVQTAMADLNEVTQHLQAARQLASQASGGTNSAAAITAIQSEVNAHLNACLCLGSSALFNGIALFSSPNGGTFSLTFLVGAYDNNTISVNLPASMGCLIGSVTVNTTTTLSTVDSFINAVDNQQALLGATVNQLQDTLQDLQVQVENMQSANAALVDVNMATETTVFTQTQVLQQSGVAILAQANQNPMALLKLLQGL